MRYSKLAIFAVLVGALALAACAPGGGGTGTTPNAHPTKLQIKAYLFTQPSPIMLTLDDAALVQKIYNSAVALPTAPVEQACPAIAGPSYDLTFYEGDQVVITAKASASGCASVTFGANDVRQPNEAFWSLLNQAVAEATPPAMPDRAEVFNFTDPQTPPLLSKIDGAEQAQQLYNAIRALPTTQDSSCPQMTGVHYTLLFFEGDKRYQAELDNTGCISGPPILGGQHQADEAFWQEFKQTLASRTTAPAKPDTLEMKTVPASNDPSTTASAVEITGNDIIQKLFDAVYALPQQPTGQACPAIVGTLYGLTFVQDGVGLLTVIADKSGCGTVKQDSYVRLADQNFWNLVDQAQKA